MRKSSSRTSIEIEASAFAEAFQILKPIAATAPPYRRDWRLVWLSVGPDGLVARGTNLETYGVYTRPLAEAPPTVLELGLTDPDKFLAYLKAVGAERLAVTEHPDGSVSLGGWSSAGLRPDEFPVPAEEPAEPAIAVPADWLVPMLRLTEAAAATRCDLPASYRYLRLRIADGTLSVCATDGNRLAWAEREFEPGAATPPVLVPTSVVKALVAAERFGFGGPFALRAAPPPADALATESPAHVLTCRLRSGASLSLHSRDLPAGYPDVEGLLARIRRQEPTAVAVADIAGTHKIVQQCDRLLAGVRPKTDRHVTLSANGRLTAAIKDWATLDLPASVEQGDDRPITVAVPYLRDAIAPLVGRVRKARLAWTANSEDTSLRKAPIYPLRIEAEDTTCRYLALVMPVI